MEIRNPKWLQMMIEGSVLYGLDQNWYRTPIKRRRGCGPVTAATLLFYMNKRENGPFGYDNTDIVKAVEMLNDVWRYVRPGIKGLPSIKKFVKGIHKLCERYGLPWECQSINVNKNTLVPEAAAFIESGINSDCPVAFLNLHAGVSTAFDGWHWLVLTGIRKEGARYVASGIDYGKQIEFDLAEWIESTEVGGGFVYLNS
ncbi:MAG: hypothetical protein FWD00_03990 [Clostridiales bacterium]|nr:hypothetical protein [Clostridiales bacterium]